MLLDDEAEAVGGKNHSHATQDLQDAIAAGDYPEWSLFIQVRRRSLSRQPGAARCLCLALSLCRASDWVSELVESPRLSVL